MNGKHRYGGKAFGKYKHGAAAAALGILVLSFCFVRGKDQFLLWRIQWENQGNTWTEEGRELAGKWVEFFWNRKISRPNEPENQEERDSFPAFLESLNPWYRYEEKDEESGGWEEPDPAYRKYLAEREFYIDHAYLLEYSGWEGTDSGENEAVQGGEEDFGTEILEEEWVQPASGTENVPGTVYSLAQLADYDFLMKTFYSVHTSTTAGRDMMNAASMLEKDFTLEKDSSEPQILIYHTHSQEAFADSEPGENVVAIGDYLAELLEAKGFGVLHDRSVYDLRDGELDRNKAYTYALEGISGILQENPSIQVILDIHRDGVGENVHLVSEVNGKPTAQIMLFNGLSQTPEGPVEYLPNPYRDDNLAFSFQLQLKAAAWYPGYTRKIYLKGLRYNLHLRPRSVLVEVGAQTNTYEEARNAMEPLAEILSMVLEGK